MSDTTSTEQAPCHELQYSRENNAEKKNSWNPPELECWQKIIKWISIAILIVVPGLFLTAALCCVLNPELLEVICADDSCLPGIFVLVSGIILMLPISIIAILWVRYRVAIHEEKVQDRSTVESLLEQACTTASLLECEQDDVEKSTYAQEIHAEIKRLREIGPDGWTYYQTLHLDLLLVDTFFGEEEVISNAELALTQLADYVADSSAPFDLKQYNKWNERLKIITAPEDSAEYWRIKHCEESPDGDGSKLLELGKERLKALKDYIADIESDWATGSVILRNLKYSSIATIIAFLLIAFLPVMFAWYANSGELEFGWFGWGLLGSVGALLSVLHKQQKFNIVELGNTEGQKEFWRVFAGGCLGLVAGLIAYALISSGVVGGRLFPSLYEGAQKCGKDGSLYLSLVWAIGAGFGFEKIFDRVKQTWGADSGGNR